MNERKVTITDEMQELLDEYYDLAAKRKAWEDAHPAPDGVLEYDHEAARYEMDHRWYHGRMMSIEEYIGYYVLEQWKPKD